MRTWRMKQLGNKMCCQICLCNHTTTVHSPQQTKVNLTDCGRNVAILGCALTSLPWHVAGWPPFISITCLVSVHVCVCVSVCVFKTNYFHLGVFSCANCTLLLFVCRLTQVWQGGRREDVGCVLWWHARHPVWGRAGWGAVVNPLKSPFTPSWETLTQIHGLLCCALHPIACSTFLFLSLSLTHTHTHSTLAFVVCERSQYVSIELSADAPLLRLVSMASFVTTDIQTVGTVWSKNIRRQMINMHGLTHTF